MTAVRNAMNEAGSISAHRFSLASIQKKKQEKSERTKTMAKRMKEKRKCIVCGKEFVPNCPIQKTCSESCRKINKYQKHRKWCANHPEAVRSYHYDEEYKYKYRPTAHCKICGKLIIQEQGMISRRKAQMHEECIIKDCVKILSETSRLDIMRCQRLVRIGYTMKEFRNEFGLQDKRY